MRSPLTIPVESGCAQLIPDASRPAGWLLTVDDVAQSYVDLDNPQHLEFEYVRRVANVLDTLHPSRTPARALHLGGGAMTIPRYLTATRPDMDHVVIERDPAVVLLVHEHLPLPPSAPIEVRVGDAREAVTTAADGEYDLVIADAYQAAAMPRDMTTIEYARQAARILAPDGVYVVNVTDLPILAFTRVLAATIVGEFADTCVIADSRMLRGRRFGNVVIAASRRGGALRVRAIGAPRSGETTRTLVLHGDSLDEFVGGARPRCDVDLAAD